MNQAQSILNNNSHCLRSKKLDEEQLLILKKTKTKKSIYRILEDSLNHFYKKNKIIYKKIKYSPPPIKRPKSTIKKKNTLIRIKNSEKEDKIKKLKEKDENNKKSEKNKNIGKNVIIFDIKNLNINNTNYLKNNINDINYNNNENIIQKNIFNENNIIKICTENEIKNDINIIENNKNNIHENIIQIENELKPLNDNNIYNVNGISKPIYGKKINNKRVIFGKCIRPKLESSPIKPIKRRIRKVLNYKKYLELKQRMINNIDNKEFTYLFQSNHKISKNYWHAKIDIISPKKYLGIKSQRSSSDSSSLSKTITHKKYKKKQKKKKIINLEKELDEIYKLNNLELNLISQLKKNLKKADTDCELLLF